MNRVLFILISLATLTATYAQNGINYQAVLRSGTGDILSSAAIDVRVSIYQDLAGTIVDFVEDHSLTTSSHGVFSLEIGTGTYISGIHSDIQSIDWSTAEKYMNVQYRYTGGGSFNDMGTTPIFAVPFAFHSLNSGQTYNLAELTDVDTSGISVGQTLVWNGTSWVTGVIDSVFFADSSSYAMNSDTANFAFSAQNVIPSDTSLFAYHSDSANYADTAGYSSFADSVIYSDTATYAINSLNAWDLNGNIVSGAEFLGTTNVQPLKFFTNNLERMRLDESGRLGVGVTNPVMDIDIYGENGFRFEGSLGSGASQSFTGDRMVYYPRKAHFYVGGGSTTHNDLNIGDYSFATGYNVSSRGDYSAAMGYASSARGAYSFAGGYDSKAYGDYSFSFGFNSSVSGETAVGMGRLAISNGQSSVALGYHPKAYGAYSVAIGYQVEAYDTSSFALGYRSRSDHKGSFVFADASTGTNFVTTADNQFRVRANGGVQFFSSSDLSTGVELAPGSGSWSTLSDSNSKENVEIVDLDELWKKADQVNVYTWNYKAQNDSIIHIGPMAQDFYNAFGLGESNKMISTVDIDGVNLSLLKGLKHEIDSKENQYRELLEKYNSLLEERKLILQKVEILEQKYHP